MYKSYNNKITIFLSAFLIYSSFLFSQKNEYKAVTVGFYNLENLFDLNNDTVNILSTEFTPEGKNKWTKERYDENLTNMSEVISLLGTDVVQNGPTVLGISEVENRSVIEDLINTPKLKSKNYKIVHYDSPDRRGIDVALIYQPKYFTVKNTSSIPLYLYKDDGERIYTRDQLLVTGDLLGEEVHFIVNHWPSRRGGEKRSRPLRNAAAELNKAIVDSLININENAKVIVMGDFNDDPDSPSIKKILNTSSDKKNVKKGELYNSTEPFYNKGIGTLAYRDNWNLFDQLIMTPALVDGDKKGWQFYKTKIFSPEFIKVKSGRYKGYPKRTYVGGRYQGGYSDHFPVYTVLIKKK